MATKKTTPKKTATKKTATKKAATKKTAAKKTATKKAATKKAATKKAATKKAATKNAATKKTATKKATPPASPIAVEKQGNPKAEALVNEVLGAALALPEAWRDHPWGDIAIKVRKKAFVFSGESKTGAWGLSVKLPHSAEVVLEMPIAAPTGYGLGKSGWVSFTLEDHDLPPASMLCQFVVESYRAIAPKTLVKQVEVSAK